MWTIIIAVIVIYILYKMFIASGRLTNRKKETILDSISQISINIENKKLPFDRSKENCDFYMGAILLQIEQVMVNIPMENIHLPQLKNMIFIGLYKDIIERLALLLVQNRLINSLPYARSDVNDIIRLDLDSFVAFVLLHEKVIEKILNDDDYSSGKYAQTKLTQALEKIRPSQNMLKIQFDEYEEYQNILKKFGSLISC